MDINFNFFSILMNFPRVSLSLFSRSSVGGDYLPMATSIQADTAENAFRFEFFYVPKYSILSQTQQFRQFSISDTRIIPNG